MANAAEKSGNNSRPQLIDLNDVSDLIDAGLSLLALLLVMFLVMHTGGFSFWQPWILWPAIVFFFLGVGRGIGTNKSLWRRVVILNIAWLLLAPIVFVMAPLWLLFLLPMTMIPTATGLYVRRRAGAWRK